MSVVPVKEKKKKFKVGLNKKKSKMLVVEPVADEPVDVEEEVPMSSLGIENKRSVGGQKLPKNVPTVPMDDVSFHKEDGVLKLRFVYHRVIFREKELSSEALKIGVIMELMHDAEMIKIVTNIRGLLPYFGEEIHSQSIIIL